jgi:hypothetical protein
MTYTRADLIKQVLYNLQKIANDEPSDDDSARVDRIIDGVVATLSSDDIYTVQDAGLPGPTGGDIEPTVFIPLSHVIALAAAPSFSMGGDPSLIGLAQKAESQMEKAAAPPRTIKELRVERSLVPYRRGFYNGSFS